MNFPGTHDSWMWVYFGAFGSLSAVFFSMTIWYWMKFHSLASAALKSASRWSIIGYGSLFCGAWFACGIGGAPGYMLSPDLNMHNLEMATGAAVLSMFFSAPGWICIMIGQRKMFKLVH